MRSGRLPGRTPCRLAAVLLAFGLTLAGAPDEVTIDWHTIAGGGGVSADTTYTVVGTVGQNAIGETSRAGIYAVTGGAQFESDASGSEPWPVLNTIHFIQNRTIKIPYGTLLQSGYSPLGLPLGIVSVSGSSANGGRGRLQSGFLIYEPAPGLPGGDLLAYTLSDGSRDAIGLIVLVADPIPGTITSNITGVQVVTSGTATGLQVTMAGIPGRTYQLQYALELTPSGQWVDLGDPAAAPGLGILELVDPAPSGTRFYRVIERTSP